MQAGGAAASSGAVKLPGLAPARTSDKALPPEECAFLWGRAPQPRKRKAAGLDKQREQKTLSASKLLWLATQRGRTAADTIRGRTGDHRSWRSMRVRCASDQLATPATAFPPVESSLVFSTGVPRHARPASLSTTPSHECRPAPNPQSPTRTHVEPQSLVPPGAGRRIFS